MMLRTNHWVTVLPSAVICTIQFKSWLCDYQSLTLCLIVWMFTFICQNIIQWCNCLYFNHHSKATKYLPRADWYDKKTDLSGDAFHQHPRHRSDGTPFRVIERALWMIQAGKWTDLVLGLSGFVWRLKDGHRNPEKKGGGYKANDLWEFKNNILSGFVW